MERGEGINFVKLKLLKTAIFVNYKDKLCVVFLFSSYLHIKIYECEMIALKKLITPLIFCMVLSLTFCSCDIVKTSSFGTSTQADSSYTSTEVNDESVPEGSAFIDENTEPESVISSEHSENPSAESQAESKASSTKPSSSSVKSKAASSAKPASSASTKSKAASSAASTSSLPGNASLKKGMTAAEYKQAYDVALGIVNLHKGKEELDMLFNIVNEISIIYGSGVHAEEGAHYSDVYGVFILKRASCAGVTRAVGLCMTILGIPYEHVNEGLWTHQWCRVFVKSENAYFILDAQGGFMGEEPAPYKHPWVA